MCVKCVFRVQLSPFILASTSKCIDLSSIEMRNANCKPLGENENEYT